MQFVTYLEPSQDRGKSSSTGATERVGLRIGPVNSPSDGRIIDALRALEWLGTQANHGAGPPKLASLDMLQIVRESDHFLPLFAKIVQAATDGRLPKNLSRAETELELIAPIPRPTSMRDGYAFRQHVEAARRNRGVPMIPEFDHFPVFYFTNHLGVTGPGPLAVQKLAQDKLDYELEVAVVVGKGGRNLSAAKADEHIFGYLIMNDWSARALQMEEMKLNLGPAKGKDFATGLGPYLVTRDELASRTTRGPTGERLDLRMRAFVNGKQLSDGNLKDMSWTFAQLLERASYGVTLHPGEVIGSGTVGTGCLLELNGSKITDNLWLKPGDVVAMEVEGLGRLENEIVDGGP